MQKRTASQKISKGKDPNNQKPTNDPKNPGQCGRARPRTAPGPPRRRGHLRVVELHELHEAETSVPQGVKRR